VTVAPLHEFNTTLSQRPAAVLFISDLDQDLDLPVDLLRRCYGLIAAEARLAMVLLEGHSLKEAADASGVTHNTAKSQLQEYFLEDSGETPGRVDPPIVEHCGRRASANSRSREEVPVQLSRLLDAHQVIIGESRKLAGRASAIGDDGTNDIVVIVAPRLQVPTGLLAIVMSMGREGQVQL